MDRGFGVSGFFIAVFFGVAAITGMQHLWVTVPLICLGVMCGVAALLIWSDAHRPKLITVLTETQHPQLYRMTMTWALPKAYRVFGAVYAPDDKNTPQILRSIWDYPLLDRALLIAVVYPIILFYLPWFWGHPATLGGAEIFAAEPRLWVRLLLVFLFVLVMASPLLERHATASPKSFIRSVSVWLVPIAFAVAVIVSFIVAGAVAFAAAIAVAGASVVAGVIAGAGIVAGALSGAVAVAVAVALVGAIPVAGAFAIAGIGLFGTDWAITKLRQDNKPGWAAICAVVFSMVLAGGTLFLKTWAEVSPDRRAIFVFLGLLPLTNGILDTVSYGTTLSTARLGLRDGGWPWVWGVLDFLFALVFLLILGAALVAVVSIANAIAGVPLVRLDLILPELHDWRQYWWLWAMAFSTLLPTLGHVLIAGFSLQPLAGRWYRDRVLAGIEGRNDALTGPIAVLGVSLLWLCAVLVPVVGLGLLGWGAYSLGAGVYSEAYFQWLLQVAIALGGV